MTQVRLKTGCPVCIDKGLSTPAFEWLHATDNGDLFINEYGTIECHSCYRTWNILDSRWGCPHHSDGRHEYRYEKSSTEATLYAIAAASCGLRSVASALFYETLLKNIGLRG